MNATVKHDGFRLFEQPLPGPGHQMPMHWWDEIVLWGRELRIWVQRGWRSVVSVADWVGRNPVLVVVAVLVALVTGGLVVGLSGLDAHFAAVMVAMCGGALSVGLVAYRAGDPDA